MKHRDIERMRADALALELEEDDWGHDTLGLRVARDVLHLLDALAAAEKENERLREIIACEEPLDSGRACLETESDAESMCARCASFAGGSR